MATQVIPETATAGNQPTTVSELSSEKMKQSLCLISMTVKGPSYRLRVDKGKLEVPDENGQMKAVDQKKVTGGSWKWDHHEIFSRLDSKKYEAQTLVGIYSIPDMKRGDRLVMLNRTPELLAKINKINNEIHTIVEELIVKWPDIINHLQVFFGDHWWQVANKLPTGDNTLHQRYGIQWSILPLIGMDPEKDLDLSKLSADDAMEVIDAHKEQVAKLFEERATLLADSIFGEAVEMCENIIYGPVDPDTGIRSKSKLEGGKHKSGLITEVMNVLERLCNFKELASADVIAQVEKARKLIGSTNIRDINLNNGQNIVTEAIKKTMTPLASALTSHMEEMKKGRAKRSVSI